MKVLVIGRSFPRPETGMLGSFEYEQAQALKNCGNDVRYTFCDTRSIFRIRNFERIENSDNGIIASGLQIPIGRLPYIIFSYIKNKYYIEKLSEIISEFNPEIIHIHFPIITLTKEVWKYLNDLRIKIVVTEHFTKVMNKKINGREISLLTKVVDECAEFICVSTPLKKSVVELTATKRNIHVIPNMVNSNFIRTAQATNDVMRFVSIGRICKNKRVDCIIDAFEMIYKTNPAIELHIVGGGPLLDKLKRKVLRKQCAENIIFYGAVQRSSVNEIINKCNYFVTASEYETFGVPVIEAWFCGLPVIIPDSFPILEYTNKNNAIIYSAGNIKQLSNAMLNAIELKYNSEAIAFEANKLFGSKAISKRIIELYEKGEKE